MSLVTIPKDDVPLLAFLKIEFTVLRNNVAISNMLDCDVPAGGNLIPLLLQTQTRVRFLHQQLNAPQRA